MLHTSILYLPTHLCNYRGSLGKSLSSSSKHVCGTSTDMGRPKGHDGTPRTCLGHGHTHRGRPRRTTAHYSTQTMCVAWPHTPGTTMMHVGAHRRGLAKQTGGAQNLRRQIRTEHRIGHEPSSTMPPKPRHPDQSRLGRSPSTVRPSPRRQ